MDAGVELLGQLPRGSERLGAAVQEVLEPDPRPHPSIGVLAVGLQEAPIRRDGLEVVVPREIGDVGRQRGPDADPFGRARRPLHEPPHVEDRRGAEADALRVAQERGRLGDLGGECPVGRIDVGAEPVPQRHRLGRAPEEAGVQVAVLEPGDDRVTGGVHDPGAAGVVRRVDRIHRTDGHDVAAVHQNGPRIVRRAGSIAGKHDSASDQDSFCHVALLAMRAELRGRICSEPKPRSSVGAGGMRARRSAVATFDTAACGPGGQPSPPLTRLARQRSISAMSQRSSNEGPTPDRIRALPKAEVHVHLEGCFEPSQLLELASAAGTQLPRRPDRLFEFGGLADFLDFLDWACALVTTEQHVSRAAYRFAEREAGVGAGHADLIVNPTHWPAWRDRLAAFVGALDAGLTEAEQDGLSKVSLCVSLLRQQSAEEAAQLVDALLELRHPRVVALSIDGNEVAAGRTGPRFADAFRRAGAAGLRRTVHAGESSGPEGVRDAVDLLQAERIDHGIRAIEDPALVRELADRGIPLDVCPGSNVALGLYRDRSSHPIDRLRRAGVPVSVNTDDPAYLRTDLVTEYVETSRAHGWSDEDLRKVASTSIEASFADDDTKASLRAALGAW